MRLTISYVSTSNPNLTHKEIQDVLDQTLAFNTMNSITGVLIYSQGNFFQILEGDKNLVRNLFDKKIQRDIRHHDIIKIIDKEIDDRAFSEYHISFKIINNTISHKELLDFLAKEKEFNQENYTYMNYLTHKFIQPY